MDDVRKYLSYGIALAVFFMLCAILWISRENEKIVFAVFTAVVNIMGILVGYYYGTSDGSQKKTELMKAMVEKGDCK